MKPKAKAEREVLILHEISIWVDLRRGAEARDSKFAVYNTGKNLINIPYNDPKAEKYKPKDGFGRFISRVPVNQLMIVQQPSYHDDATDCVRREIYCLDEDVEQALHMIRDAVQKRMDEMKAEMEKLYAIWKKNV